MLFISTMKIFWDIWSLCEGFIQEFRKNSISLIIICIILFWFMPYTPTPTPTLPLDWYLGVENQNCTDSTVYPRLAQLPPTSSPPSEWRTSSMESLWSCQNKPLFTRERLYMAGGTCRKRLKIKQSHQIHSAAYRATRVCNSDCHLVWRIFLHPCLDIPSSRSSSWWKLLW